MSGTKQNRQTYNQTTFRRILNSKANANDSGIEKTGSKIDKPKTVSFKKDNCDLLIYLIYVNYLNDLVSEAGSTTAGGAGAEGELTESRVEKTHEKLLKRYRG
jgi:hypothetical protein